MDDEESKEQSDGLRSGGNILSIGGNGDGTQNHTGQSKLSRGDSSGLTEQVQPSDSPSDNGLVLSGHEVGRCRVETSVRGVCRDELSNTCAKSETEDGSEGPHPNNRCGSTQEKRGVEGSRNGTTDTHDTESKRDGGQVCELSHEFLLVTHPGEVGLVRISDRVDILPANLGHLSSCVKAVLLLLVAGG